MEIFNIGPMELIVFLILAFLLLGPKDMILTAYKIGEQIRKFVRSPVWREILRSAQDIRELPTKLMDETGLKEELEAIKKDTQDTVKEVNSTMNDAIGDMRVPEAEHIRLETGPVGSSPNPSGPKDSGPKIEPAMRTMSVLNIPEPRPAVTTPKKLPGEVDGAPIPSTIQPAAQEMTPEAVEEIPAAVEQPAAAEQPAVVETQPVVEELPVVLEPQLSEVPQEAKPKRASRKKVEKPVEVVAETGETVAETLGTGLQKSAPRTGSRKKAQSPKVEVPEISAEAVMTEAEPQVIEPEAPVKRRAVRKKVEPVEPVEPPADPVAAASQEASPEAVKAPRLARRKKAVVEMAQTLDSPDLAADTEKPVEEETAVQASPRRTRARKNGSTAEGDAQV